MSRASEQPRLWLPPHWPAWIGLGLFWVASRLDWSEQRRLARALGWAAYHLVPIRRRVVLTNLRLCFPEKSTAEIRTLARAHYDSLALGLFEVCAAWWADSKQLPPYRLVGLDHFRAALARGRGAILLTGHFTTIEICGRLLIETQPMGCLYRDPNNPVIAFRMRRQREQRMSVAVHFEDLRGLVRALREGYPIWYAPDQSRRTKSSEVLPFLGVPAITNTATGKIAAMTGAPVVPYFSRREADYSYTISFQAALDNFPTGDATADTLRINELIAEQVRLTPEQYLWVHRRFKARGPGYPEVY